MRTTIWFLVFALGLAALFGSVSAALASAEAGKSAPPLTVQQFDGRSFDLAAEHGKVVVVSFWATWCPPCRAEMPALDAVYRRYHKHGLEMIGLSADRPHDKADAYKIMQSFSYPAAMLSDADPNGFGAPSSLPLTIIVDRDGVVRAEFTPDKTPLTEAGLSDAIVPLLDGPATSSR